jgi:hypothetical protein
MGRAGKLNINIDNAKLVDGEKAPLRAMKEVKGGSHNHRVFSSCPALPGPESRSALVASQSIDPYPFQAYGLMPDSGLSQYVP